MRFSSLLAASTCLLAALVVRAEPATLTIPADAAGKPISADLFGIFFEDLNHAADGGLYAELVQNRSFEFEATEKPTWNNLTGWELVTRGAAKGTVVVDASYPLNPNNPHYVVVSAETPGDGVGLMNSGYNGVPVKQGEEYEVSFFGREHFFGRRWGDQGKSGLLPVEARLEAKDGTLLGSTRFEVTERAWRHFSATITANRTDPEARLVLLCLGKGGVGFDEISLFPKKTFRNRPNGLRADLAETIAALKPRFVRFPGGCLVHGNGLGNMYRWKDTIGPIEQRRGQANLWGYHQSVGLGYFEYFQFCEDIGAKPLPVVPAGVCCQNSGHGLGQAGLPLADMPAYIQDVLDLIEWANGPVDSTWGSKRAAAGHPAPFGLQYLGVGNEDQITPDFAERFQMIYAAVKAKHPEITVIGTAGPFPKGEDFEAGWKVAHDLKVPVVDEHYYQSPEWFWENLARYDGYDRAQGKVYVGEYAAHDGQPRRNTLRSAIAEAAYLTSLERNGDVVAMASYAPLLARRGYVNWEPDLIYFNGTEVFPSLNYHVQQLFGTNHGDAVLPAVLAGAPARVVTSVVRDHVSGELILKIVNGTDAAAPLQVVLTGGQVTTAVQTTFGGVAPDTVNTDGQPGLQPQTTTRQIGPHFELTAPAWSLTVMRVK